ncbi:hypothetical protein AMELA_G00094970, partial [Ameiurus melas]
TTSSRTVASDGSLQNIQGPCLQHACRHASRIFILCIMSAHLLEGLDLDSSTRHQ